MSDPSQFCRSLEIFLISIYRVGIFTSLLFSGLHDGVSLQIYNRHQRYYFSSHFPAGTDKRETPQKLLFLNFTQLLLGCWTLLFLLFFSFWQERKKGKKLKQNTHIFWDISKPVFQKLIAVMVDDICHSSIQTLNLLRFTHFNPEHLCEHHPSHICQRRHKPSKSLVGFCSIQEKGVKGSSTIGETAVRKRQKTSQERSLLFFRFFGDFNKSERCQKDRCCLALPSQRDVCSALHLQECGLSCHAPRRAWQPLHGSAGVTPTASPFCKDPAASGDPCSWDSQHSSDDTEQCPWSPQP